MKKTVGDRILVLGGMVCDEDAWSTIREVHDNYYIVHVDGDPQDEIGAVDENGNIVFLSF